jgi:hypothetical protein
MPVAYNITWSEAGAICKYLPPFSPNDSIGALVEISKINHYPDFRFVIHDFTEALNVARLVAITVTVGASSILPIESNSTLKTAVITDNIQFENELRYFKKLTARSIEIFHQLEDAVKWTHQ